MDTLKLTAKEVKRASQTDCWGKQRWITIASRRQPDRTYRYFLVEVGTGIILESDTSPQETARWYQKCGGYSPMTKAARSRDKRAA